MVAFPKSTQTRVTFAEYSQRPETNQIVELIDGEIVVNSPRDIHQKTHWRISATLIAILPPGEARAAPAGLRIDDYHSFEPDIFWVSEANSECRLGADGRYWQGAPDLVIEILSPSTASYDRGYKYDTYERIGVREYWLVDPDLQNVEVHQLVDGSFRRLGFFQSPKTFRSPVLNAAEVDISVWFESAHE
jgi:Uma2 family endonuclease